MRYAIYFSPSPDDALTRKASRWLGRNAFRGSEDDNDADQRDMTAEPRRYGFHATLKAPFELADRSSEAELLSAFQDFTRTRQAFEIPDVIIDNLGPFFAIVPKAKSEALQDFAADVVAYFEPFRAALSPSDIARRRPQELSESQRRNLSQWGYPHVMDDFRFHMTLTGPVETKDRDRVRTLLMREFSDFTERSLAISGLGLFVERARGEAFTVHTWLPLAGAPDTLRTTPVEKEAIR